MQQYMQRAIELAKLGLGRTYPNPLVGCVIVRKGEIIGEGWHRKAGEPHAEVHAINSVRDREGLKDACLYVNLEPCAHQGKTPPCCDLIIEHKIPKVVIANIDPHDKVAGQGIARLKDSGTEVIVGVCASEGEQLNRRFFTVHRKKRPYVLLKWAESRDGFMDAERRPGQMGSFAISGAESRSLSHLWRTQEESILVGRKTAEVDDPLLNARAVHGRSPTVVLIDPQRSLRL
ncbi:MAG: bifunctional diaminohydroxyphosphoribosylaminopyrimidine deaminase/5-amino-6-(5-phosphoribosylamino)uracil reductase RibD, partial [Flavobacteriia bacterium]|nr:bifunctional diaminohydroxyphosphoribosylaminopyrimidine deaminase/5-amino-6-(5-phosphoribosylamino)uracil reductase RibD [Flavobacteriia bacterium]